ncbi:MAG: response regulator [Acidobacteriota bacterium]
MARILVVEDDLSSGESLRAHLARLGWPSDEAPDGDHAIRRCREHRYRLMIIDLHKNETRELFFLQRVRLLAPDLPVLVLSARSPMKNVAAAFRWGATDWLRKPVEPMLLEQSIDHLME